MKSAVAVLAIVFAQSNPSAPNLNVTINSTFNNIVEAPKIKLLSEYNFIFPFPLAIALLSPIRIFDIINVKNAIVY